MNFGRTERPRYKKFIVPIFGSFLQKCYCKSSQVVHVDYSLTMYNLAPEECRARALAVEEGFEGLESMDLESSGADFDSIMPASNTIQPDTSAPTSNPTTASLDATSSSRPCMSTSPPPLSRANTPAPSPATHSLPNTPPISPARSLLNSPACSPTLNNAVPF